MARIVMVLLGLLALAGGIRLGVLWWGSLLILFKGLAILLLCLIGLALLILGISEIAGGQKKDRETHE